MARTSFMSPMHRARQTSTSKTMQPRAWLWALSGALLGLLAVITMFAPAHWLAWVLANASNGHVLLSDTQGTVWQGSARLVLAGGQGSREATALPTNLHWRLSPRLFGADAELRSSCCTHDKALFLQLRTGTGGTRIHLADTSLQLPGELLAGLGTPWNTLQLQGDIYVKTQQVQIWLAQQRMNMQGQIRVELRQMSTRMSTINPIGSYALDLHGSDAASGQQTAGMVLSTLPGSSLLLTGSGQWTGGRLHFRGEASAAPDRAEALNNLLNIIGRRDGARSLISLG